MTLFRNTASGLLPSGAPWSIRVHHSSSAAVSAVEADWLAQITSWWTDGTHGVGTLFPTGTTLTETKTEQLQVVTITAGTGTVDKIRAVDVAFDNPALAGTSANAALPDQNVVVVSLRTGLPGRENRGRYRLPAPDETLVTAGELGSVPATRVTTAGTALLTGMAGAGHQPCRVTYTKTKIGTPVGSFRAFVSPVETDRVIRTLRGRVKSRKAVYV